MRRIETPRLILRPWVMSQRDAEDLYDYARDPRVGPLAGWPVHRGLEDSQDVLAGFVRDEGELAIQEKESCRVIGSIGLHRRDPDPATAHLPHRELGYCLHPGFWGRGLMTEAVQACLWHGFSQMGLALVWCGHYQGNERSKRVIERCRFSYAFSRVDAVPALQEERLCHYYQLTREAWRGWQS